MDKREMEARHRTDVDLAAIPTRGIIYITDRHMYWTYRFNQGTPQHMNRQKDINHINFLRESGYIFGSLGFIKETLLAELEAERERILEPMDKFIDEIEDLTFNKVRVAEIRRSNNSFN